GDVAVGLNPYVSVEVFDNITTNPPTRTDGINSDLAQVALAILPFVDVNLGLMERLDLYYTTGLGLRYQWLGEIGKEGWKSTLWGGLNALNINADDTEGTTTAKSKVDGFEYGLSFGRDFGNHSLIYVTVGKTTGGAKTTITQPANVFKYSDDFEHTILSLGANVGHKWYFWAEASATETRWKTKDAGSSTQTNSSYLIGIGTRF
ncbi:MAG: hypothetical protein ACK5V3_09980, partial [Bdellovibrionales bacterium]